MKTLATSDLQAFSAEVSSYSQRLGLGLEFGDSTEKEYFCSFYDILSRSTFERILNHRKQGGCSLL